MFVYKIKYNDDNLCMTLIHSPYHSLWIKMLQFHADNMICIVMIYWKFICIIKLHIFYHGCISFLLKNLQKCFGSLENDLQLQSNGNYNHNLVWITRFRNDFSVCNVKITHYICVILASPFAA